MASYFLGTANSYSVSGVERTEETYFPTKGLHFSAIITGVEQLLQRKTGSVFLFLKRKGPEGGWSFLPILF